MPDEPTGDDLPAEEDPLARYGELIEAERGHRPSEAMLWDAYNDTEHQLARAMSLIGTLAPDPSMTEVMLERVTIEDGILGVHIQNPEPFAKLMAWHMREILDVFGQGRAKNFLAWKFNDPEHGFWEMCVTRPDGESPAMKASRLTAWVDDLAKMLDDTTADDEAPTAVREATWRRCLDACRARVTAARDGLTVEEFEARSTDG